MKKCITALIIAITICGLFTACGSLLNFVMGDTAPPETPTTTDTPTADVTAATTTPDPAADSGEFGYSPLSDDPDPDIPSPSPSPDVAIYDEAMVQEFILGKWVTTNDCDVTMYMEFFPAGKLILSEPGWSEELEYIILEAGESGIIRFQNATDSNDLGYRIRENDDIFVMFGLTFERD